MKVEIGPLNVANEAAACAEMLATSEPWKTLQLSLNGARARLTDSAKEVYAARDTQGVAGFIILDMRGVLAGYIQTVCVRADRRGQGIGTALIRWAEERIFRDSPNVFMCVSSFNPDACRLYQRLGYERVGVLRAFVVPAHNELLLRKTRGSWIDFRNQQPALR
jgi:[ribosomal protein S18]-alanine N-acetyltransferase